MSFLGIILIKRTTRDLFSEYGKIKSVQFGIINYVVIMFGVLLFHMNAFKTIIYATVLIQEDNYFRFS